MGAQPSPAGLQMRLIFGKRFLHDWASEQRSRRDTTVKRLVRTSRIFFVFMGKVTNPRNQFSVENPTYFLWKIYPTLTHSLYSLYLLYSLYSSYADPQLMAPLLSHRLAN